MVTSKALYLQSWLVRYLRIPNKFVLLFFLCLGVVFTGYAQEKTKFKLKIKNTSVHEVIQAISEQSNFEFVYNNDDLQKLPKVDIDVTDAPIKQVLDICFKNTNMEYKIVDKVIIISPKQANEGEQKKKTSQDFTISGRVADEEGFPLPGATVLIKGTFKGTTTNSDGNYSIKVSKGSVLVFSFVGYQTQEIAVSSEKTEIDVVMQESVAELGEVAVISTGYQLIKPEQSTGSVAIMRVKEYNSRINTTDFLTSLENRIPGLLINNDIDFEGNSLFQIRGISTINGGRQPLIVLDGFPTELSLDMINPNEIESVTVLKDAAAATVYGVRASNGVIVIERKKAKAGKVNVNFQATAGFTPKENYDRYRWDEDASNTIIEYNQIYYKNSITSSTWDRIISPGTGKNYNYPAPGLIMAQESASVITEEEAEQQFEELGAYNNTKDYARLFLRTAVTQTYNLDISGGNDNALYYITVSYADNNASQIKNGSNQFRLSGRSMIKFSERFSLNLTTDFQQSKSTSVPIPDIGSVYPFERFQDDEGNPLPLYNGSNTNSYYNDYLISIGLMDNMYYPLVDINEISDKTHTINNRITANFRYNIGNGFTFNFGGVYETSHTDTKHLANENSSETRQYINFYATEGYDGPVLNIPQGGFLKQNKASRESYTLRAQLNYDKQITKDHSLNLILGWEVRDVLDKSNTASYFGYSDQTLLHQPVDYTLFSYFSPPYINNSSLSYTSLFNQKYTDNRYFSVYSNVVYAYKGKYSFTGSIRIDQSNLFGTNPKYKYKPLWSVGAAWNIHKEKFMPEADWIKSLKLRIAYGFNGNVAKNALPEVIAKAGLYNFSSGTVPILYLISYANSGLRWEQTRNFNMGLDFSIFKNITGSIDYYSRKSRDLLATNQIDATQGGTSAIINQASIRNNGLEISLHADWITRKSFNWNTGLVFAYNNSKVLQVYNIFINPTSSSSDYVSGSYSNYLEGYAIGAMFSYRYAGTDSEGYPLIYEENGNPKQFTYNGPKSDVDYSGKSIPSFNLGLSNRVDIGNFYVYCMINFYGSFKVRVPMPDPSVTRPLEGAANYWKQAGDEVNPNILPAIDYRNYDFLS